MPFCFCGRSFRDAVSLKQHRDAKKHDYCPHCEPLNEVADTSQCCTPSFRCEACGSKFAFAQVLKQHREATGHGYCHDCDRSFGSDKALQDHLRSSIHATQFHCCDCNRDFVNSKALQMHLADKIHEPKKAVRSSLAADSNSYCKKCEREFINDQALEQHLSSVIHRPLGQIECTGGKGCKRQFTSPSALVHHLESGACRSGITRKSLNALVRSNDIEKLISNDSVEKSTLSLDCDDAVSNSSSGGVPVLTPSTQWSTRSAPLFPSPFPSGVLTPVSDFEKPPSDLVLTISLSCPQCSKKFRNLQALQNHISSPVHEPKIFHCPLSITAPLLGDSEAKKATKIFSTLSGLTQHLESGACMGGKGVWRLAMDYIEERMRQRGCKKWRLLK